MFQRRNGQCHGLVQRRLLQHHVLSTSLLDLRLETKFYLLRQLALVLETRLFRLINLLDFLWETRLFRLITLLDSLHLEPSIFRLINLLELRPLETRLLRLITLLDYPLPRHLSPLLRHRMEQSKPRYRAP